MVKRKLAIPVPEKAIKKNIIVALQSWGITAWSMYTGGIPCRAGRNGIIMRPNPARGIADIIGVLSDGVFLAVEVKTATGRQSDVQKIFQEKLEAKNGLYILARSVADVKIELSNRGYL